MAAHTETSDEARRHAELMFARPWTFVRGVPSLEFLPPADRPEIAFAGRSNVGKSSLINALVNQHGLARTSNTPGRTQELNYFQTDAGNFFLVDMPGYGFARAPKDKVDAWTGLIRDYLRGRQTLRRVFVLIDSRHGIKPIDLEIFGLLDEAAVTYQIVLTKADKIKPPALEHVIEEAATSLKSHAAAFPDVIPTSSAKGLGLTELRMAILSAIT
ncbi:MAG: YihA family ribosome biogenesis GTP-binding protein [Hyphomicrobiaceae bacterium]|nr:YihA family ribosome biogenesis GTP-binding protein [Hyphomicrobiaceae bacterium]